MLLIFTPPSPPHRDPFCRIFQTKTQIPNFSANTGTHFKYSANSDFKFENAVKRTSVWWCEYEMLSAAVELEDLID